METVKNNSMIDLLFELIHITYPNDLIYSKFEFIKMKLFEATDMNKSLFPPNESEIVKHAKITEFLIAISKRNFYDFFDELICCLMINDEVVNILRQIIHTCDHNNNTLLHIFCRNKFDIAIQILLEMVDCRPIINKPNIYGDTPLSLYLNSGLRSNSEYISYTTIKKLLDRGADPNIANQNNVVPLMRSLYHGYEMISTILLKYGADPNIMIDRSAVDPRNLVDTYDPYESELSHGLWYAFVNEEERTIKELLINGCVQKIYIPDIIDVIGIIGKNSSDIELCDPVAFQIMLCCGFDLQHIAQFYGIIDNAKSRLRNNFRHMMNHQNTINILYWSVDVDTKNINHMRRTSDNDYKQYEQYKKAKIYADGRDIIRVLYNINKSPEYNDPMIIDALNRFDQMIINELNISIFQPYDLVTNFKKRRLGNIPDNFPNDLVKLIGDFIDPFIRYKPFEKMCR